MRIHQQPQRHPNSLHQSLRSDNHVFPQPLVEEQQREEDRHGELDEAGLVGLPERAVEVLGEGNVVVDRNKTKRHLRCHEYQAQLRYAFQVPIVYSILGGGHRDRIRLSIHGNVVVVVGKSARSVTVICSQADSRLSLLLSVGTLGNLLDSGEELV